MPEQAGPSAPQPHGGALPPWAERFEQASDLRELAARQDQEDAGDDAAVYLAGRYRIEQLLGQGGMGVVYLAQDTRLGRRVAIKCILPEHLTDPQATRRFFREAEALARLNHPHILTLFDSGQDGATHYLVMEVGGRDLAQIIERQAGPLPLEPTLLVARAVARALDYAHRHGVIHLDLKPGNVLVGDFDDPPDAPLTAATSIKVMDFGLAKVQGHAVVTAPRTRAGTPQYMSPEQARGADAGARADLYALGVLLYELATGVRPFDGEDARSILTQQLTLDPTPPRVFNDALPAALESLILRLLEKAPDRRPASAAETLRLLDGIAAALPPPALAASDGTGVAGATPGEAGQSSGAAASLYRPTFTGRETELRQLRAAYDAAAVGQGALAMVVGPPGMGKTALCEQFAAYVAQRGGRVLWGHCAEDGDPAIPYLPFVEALRADAAGRPPETLRREAGAGAAELALLVPDVGERLGATPRPAGDPEEARWRLLEAVSGLLRAGAAKQPLALILEDLHWADRGALDLLVHLCRNLSGARLLVLGTYRNIEVDRAHPLAQALAELHRTTFFIRAQLTGLPPEDVRRMVQDIAGGEAPDGFVEAVQRQTEGNPLFVQQVIRHLAEAGRLAQNEERLALEIPEGLPDVIGRRLSGLGAGCNRALAVAAIIGRRFDLETLGAVTGDAPDALATVLDPAVRRALVQQEPDGGGARYRFAHALVRRTLAEEMRAPRRIRLHQQVARALEGRHAGRVEEHAAELAGHFAHSSDPADLTKAVQYGEMAARRAMALSAFAETARLREEALEVQDLLDPADQAGRCDLLLDLCEALLPAGEPQRVCQETAEDAFALAAALEDGKRAARACRLAFVAAVRLRPAGDAPGTHFERWQERAERWAAPGGAAWGWVQWERGWRALADGRRADARERLAAALEAALASGDDELFCRAAGSLLGPGIPQAWSERLALARTAAERLRGGAQAGALARGKVLELAGAVLLDAGQGNATEECWQAMEGLAGRMRDPLLLLWAKRHDAVRAAMSGRLERAAEVARQLAALGEQLGVPLPALELAAMHGDPALALVMRADEALALVEAWMQRTLQDGAALRPVQTARRALALARLEGAVDPGPAVDAALAQAEQDGGAAGTAAALDTLAPLLEAATLRGANQLIERLRRALAPFAALYLASTGACVGRLLGDAALRLGDRTAAAEGYRQALTTAVGLRCRPETALIRLGMAELAKAEEYTAEARAHLEFAVPELIEMQMKPALARALRLRAALH